MDAAELRPLGVGEILDAGIKIYRRRFGTIVRAVAAVVVPVSIVSGIVGVSAATNNSTSDADFSGSDAALLGAFVVVGLIGVVASQLATAASFQIVSGDYLDTSPTWQESLRAALRKLHSVLWVTVLGGICVVIGAVACIVPGVYLYTMFAVAIPVLLFEDKRGGKALSRSRSLIQGRGWATFAVLIVTAILSSVVRLPLQGILLAMVGHGNDVADAFARSLANIVSTVVVTPFSAAVVTVLYFDMRVRKEGFDLELLARQVGVDPPARPDDLLAPEPRSEEPPYWPPPPGWQPGGRPPPRV